jgi:hypothetical protein
MFGLFGGSQNDIYGDTTGLSGGYGGVGRGLGGMSNTLMMAGLGLMSSPRNNPYEGLMKGVIEGSKLDEKSNDKEGAARAMERALVARGVDPGTARAMARYPEAAKVFLEGQDRKESLKIWEQSQRDEPGTSLPETGGGSAPRLGPRSESPAGAPSMAGGGSSRSMSMPINNPELAAAIEKHATAAGLNPTDLATAMSYETAGTFDPWKAGPRTKWGQHRGLIQWGEPQARQYGVAADTPVDQQVAAAVSYLQDRGVKPGHGLMEIYSAINAGGVGPKYYGMSDAAAGGAPGTVADKVNNQMGGHRQKAEALLRSLAPRQVASADSTFMPGPLSEEDVGIAPPADPIAETKARTGVDWNNPVARQHMIDAGLTPPSEAATAPAASTALRPSYTGTPPGYDWRTATDPGPAASPAQQQTANVPLPPERPPETYAPRAPLQPVAAQPPVASIDPNSSNAGAIQFAASGMGRGGMPAAPQPSRMATAPQAATVASQPSQTAGVQVAQAPSQTATDASPRQAQVVVQQAEKVAQAGANIPDPAQARTAGNQSTLAQEHYRQFLRLNKWASHPLMPKPYADAMAKRAEFHKDMAKEYLKPAEAEKLAAAAGLTGPEYRRAIAGAIPGNAETGATKEARILNPNNTAEGLRELKKLEKQEQTIKVGPDEDEFSKKAAGAQVERLSKMVTAGDDAVARMADIQTLRETSQRVGREGKLSDFKAWIGPYADAAGIDVSKLSDIQLYESITKRLAPQLRVTGSGQTSDIEYKGFVKAIGPLSNNPQAREMVLDAFESATRNEVARAEIASRILNREISRADGEKELRALPDPLSAFKEWKKANPELYKQATSASPEAGGNTTPAPSGTVDSLNAIPLGKYGKAENGDVYYRNPDGRLQLYRKGGGQ